MNASLFDNFVCHKIDKKKAKPRKTKSTDVSGWWPSDEDREYARKEGFDPDRLIQEIHWWAANAPRAKRMKPRPDLFWKKWISTAGSRSFNGRQRDKLRFDHL